MSKEEKMKRLLEMQEHPERYTDEEIRQLMADEECRLLYTQMVRATDAMFEARHAQHSTHLSPLTSHPSPLTSHLSSLKKVAAVFIGVLMLSGIAYAAVQWLKASPSPTEGQEVETQPTTALSNRTAAATKELEEAAIDSVRVFSNAPLDTILQEVGTFYRCETVFKNEEVKHVRLYFTWDKTKPVDDVIKTFNQFERFHITRENQQLIVDTKGR